MSILDQVVPITHVEKPKPSGRLLDMVVPVSNSSKPGDGSPVIDSAKKWLGTPYKWGGTGKKGIDCSAFTRNVLGEHGTNLPRTAAEQFRASTKVKTEEAQPGDLVFLQNTGKRTGITHVGIYMGDGKMIHAAAGTKSRGVIEDRIDTPYNKAHFVGIRRPGGATAKLAKKQDAEAARQKKIGLVEKIPANDVIQGLHKGDMGAIEGMARTATLGLYKPDLGGDETSRALAEYGTAPLAYVLGGVAEKAALKVGSALASKVPVVADAIKAVETLRATKGAAAAVKLGTSKAGRATLATGRVAGHMLRPKGIAGAAVASGLSSDINQDVESVLESEGWDQNIDKQVGEGLLNTALKELPRAIVGTPLAFIGFKADLYKHPAEALNGMIQPFVSPVKSFTQAPISTSLMWLMVGGSAAGKLKSGITDSKIRGHMAEAVRLKDAGDIDGAMASYEQGISRVKQFKKMAPEDQQAYLGIVKEQLSTAPGGVASGESIGIEARVMESLIRNGYGTPEMEARLRELQPAEPAKELEVRSEELGTANGTDGTNRSNRTDGTEEIDISFRDPNKRAEDLKPGELADQTIPEFKDIENQFLKEDLANNMPKIGESYDLPIGRVSVKEIRSPEDILVEAENGMKVRIDAEEFIRMNQEGAPKPAAPFKPVEMPKIEQKPVTGRKLAGAEGKKVTATGADPNVEYQFKHKIVELDDLVPSHTDMLGLHPEYPADWQPRLRDRAASEMQIDKIARSLNPDALTRDTGSIDRGAPISGPDAIVESGNGRVLAMRRARAKYPDKWDEYKQKLADKAAELGIDEDAILGMRDPVLIRERVSEVDRPAFMREANETAAMSMSAYEDALQDAGRIGDGSIKKMVVGENQSVDQALRDPANKDLVQDFVGNLPENEHARVLNADGKLNQQGLQRLKSALFTKTYPGDAGKRLSRTFVESLDSDVRNIEQAMFQTLPEMARVETLIKRGERPAGLGIAEDISKAVDKLSRLRESGSSVKEFVNQTSLMRRELNPLQEELLVYLDEIGRSRKKVKSFIEAYTESVQKQADPSQGSLLDEVKPPTKKELITNAIERQRTGDPESAGTDGKGKELARSESGGDGSAEKGSGRSESKRKQAARKSDNGQGRAELDKAASGDLVSLDQKVSKVINADVPEADTFMPALSVKVVNKGAERSAENQKSSYSFTDQAMEDTFRAGSKGLTRQRLTDKVSEGLATLYRKGTRTHALIPRTGAFAEANEVLRRIGNGKESASTKALRYLQYITLPLEKAGNIKENYDIFRRKVVLEDLAETAARNEILPVGYTAEKMQAELKRLDSVIESNPHIKENLSRRKEVMDTVVDEYIASMAEIGKDVTGTFTRENYFRHQVLEYMQDKGLTASGPRFQVPIKRGFMKNRQGSTKIISTNYIQAEFEVLSQMIHDAERARLWKRLADEYDIKQDLRESARTQNYEELVGGPENVKRIRDLESQLAEIKAEPNAKDQVKTLTEELNKLDPSRTIKSATERESYIQEQLGDRYLHWKHHLDDRIIPEGYARFQPEQGNVFFRQDVMPADMAAKAMDEVMNKLGVDKETRTKILAGIGDPEVMPEGKSVIALGPPKRDVVIPAEIAGTLEKMAAVPPDSAVLHTIERGQTLWKQYVLLNPKRLIKYNLRNISGDADAAFVGNPSAFLKVPEAIKELNQLYRSTRAPEGDLADFVERGGPQGTLQAQDIADVNNLAPFMKLVEGKTDWNLIRRYWKGARLATDFRESIMRYAAYKDYFEQISKDLANGGEGRPKNFGASIREEVMALKDPKDRAYKLSNELLGAYDEVSELGRDISKYVVPFWRWNEVNFGRNIRLFRNAWEDGDLASTVGRKIEKTLPRMAANTAGRAYYVGKWALKASALQTVLTVYNTLRYPDEEKELSEEERMKPHIVLGRNTDGSIKYFNKLGMMGDFLEWFGADESPRYVKGFLNGQMTIKDVALDMVQKPINKLIQGVSPIYKTGTEVAVGSSTYPDIFNPRRIRDRGEYAAQQASLREEYNAAMGKPGRGLRKYAESFYSYNMNPEETSYYEILEAKDGFQEKMGKHQGGGYSITPRSNALYYYKRSILLEDRGAAKKWENKYYDLGGTDKGMVQSINTFNPLYGLNEAEQAQFMEYLTPEQKQKLEKAMKYYERLEKVRPSVETGNRGRRSRNRRSR
ncbi:MAG: NlpC/P60 family protein [Armatimonadota bacterium]